MVVGAAVATWLVGFGNLAERFLTRAQESKKSNFFIDYVDAARLYVTGLALEVQEIVAEAMAIIPESNDEKAGLCRRRSNGLSLFFRHGHFPFNLSVAVCAILFRF
jgi:hypothetical protein